LCSKLQNNLKIIINNVAMANVCSVPISYLFLRGQGIKGVSLVSRVCRLNDYLLEDKDIKQVEDESGYEGATVLDPKQKGFITKPVAVLDYASLYPRSMIHRNISPENLVLDEKYKNVEGYHYHKVEIKTEEGLETHLFAQKGDEKGILPNILRDLLDNRSKTRKEQKDEKDPFQWSVLEGKQLAYKLTANSIYGLYGAKTNMLYCKPIAASTTATGREMLMTAIDFMEKKFNRIVDYINK